MTTPQLTLADVQAAQQRIKHQIKHTPLLTNQFLDTATSARVWLKPENLQHTGSFKFRGASNAILSSPDGTKQQPVVAWSSGNHAQGVAAAAALANRQAHIVMPADAPLIKQNNTRNYGAQVVLYDRYTESREDIGLSLAKELGAQVIAPYDDYAVMAGQGTSALEFVEGCPEPLDYLLVCCGGGGLSAGVSTVFKALSPNTQVLAVEPEGFDDHARSLEAGERQANASGGTSICDALLAPTPGHKTFEINRHTLAGALVVSENHVREAVYLAATQLKLVVEPGGAAALAALLAHKQTFANKKVGVYLTGGNIDPDVLRNILSHQVLSR